MKRQANSSASALAAIPSADHLAILVGAPLPSVALSAVARAASGLAPTSADAGVWPSISTALWPGIPPRELALCVGRRGLKTSLSSLLLVASAIEPAHDSDAPRGSRLHFIGVAPRLEQSRELLHAALVWLERVAMLGIAFEARGLTTDSPEIEVFGPFTTRRLITVRAADETNVRGLAVPCAVVDEAAFMGVGGARDGAAILRALRPSMAQFKRALLVHASSPGAPQGYFHEITDSPPEGTLLVRAPTWVMNPAVTEERCRQLANGDEHAFEQEYAARRNGWGGERFIPSEAVQALPMTRAGSPIPGAHYVLAIDYASRNDETAICVASVRLDAEGRLRVVIEHLEGMQGSRLFPLSARTVGLRVATLSKKWNDAQAFADQFGFADLQETLRERGVRCATVPMDPGNQTRRAQLLRTLTLEGRISLFDDGGETRKQLQSLVAHQLPSHALRVEAGSGHDDRADVVLIAAEAATRLPPIHTEQSLISEVRHVGSIHEREGLRFERQWFRVVAGQRIPAPPPEGTPEFERAVDAYLRGAGGAPSVADEGDRRRRDAQHPLNRNARG